MATTGLAEPCSQIFVDRAEADWAFDLLRDTAKQLGLQGAYDSRFALTLARRGSHLSLNLNFGGWLVLGFHGPGRVDLTLLANRVAWDERFDSFPFESKEGEPEVRSYHLPLEVVRPMSSDLQAAWEATLDFIAQKFQNWKRTIHWKQNNPEIIEALFKSEQRERVFAGLLTEAELRYERHLTAFYQDVSEEREEYEAKMRGGEDETEKRRSEEARNVVNQYMSQRGANMNLSQISDQLITAFLQFQHNPEDLFVVKLRRKRAEQIRRLLSNPDLVDLDTFNREVWGLQSGIYWQGKNISPILDPAKQNRFSLDQIIEWDQALDVDQIEIHGNSIWGSASRVYAPRLKDDSQKLTHIRQALAILNDSNLAPLQKAQQIDQIYGFGKNITTGLVMIFHPNEFGLYNEQGKQILENLGHETVEDLISYQETLQQIREKLNADDFIELDWFLYLVNYGKYNLTKSDEILEEPHEISTAPASSSLISPPSSLPALAGEIGLDETDLARWIRAIERKKQAILYGPPGTGKTFVAEKLAQHLVRGGNGFWELVQFHPSYAYEDFIQGIRPEGHGDHLSYPMKPGRFLEFCRQAARHSGPCVLIIDEINRANLSRVFGELMYLLEYRDRAIHLAGGGQFHIPANVRLIGTMNTADRSIALVDHALRRRFAFIALYPHYDLLRRYHEQKQTGFPIEALITRLQKLNRAIGDPHYEVGVTFFLHKNLADELEDIWRMEIEPYLEEYFFDRPETVADFRWEKIKMDL